MRCAAEIFRKISETRRSRLNRLLKACVFAELHESGETHYHFLLLAEYPWSFVPLARTLRAEGICVDFSDGHDYYWTGFVYLNVPGLGPAKKKECDLDHEPWLSPDHPSVAETIRDIPRGARLSDKDRVRLFLQISDGRDGSDGRVSITDKTFASYLTAKSLRTKLVLQAWIGHWGVFIYVAQSFFANSHMYCVN